MEEISVLQPDSTFSSSSTSVHPSHCVITMPPELGVKQEIPVPQQNSQVAQEFSVLPEIHGTPQALQNSLPFHQAHQTSAASHQTSAASYQIPATPVAPGTHQIPAHCSTRMQSFLETLSRGNQVSSTKLRVLMTKKINERRTLISKRKRLRQRIQKDMVLLRTTEGEIDILAGEITQIETGLQNGTDDDDDEM